MAPPAQVTFASMRLKHAGAFVKCSACQGEDFYPAFPLTKDRRDVMVCARCENQAVFGEMIGKPSVSAHSAKMPWATAPAQWPDRKSTRLNSSHVSESRMPSSA